MTLSKYENQVYSYNMNFILVPKVCAGCKHVFILKFKSNVKGIWIDQPFLLADFAVHQADCVNKKAERIHA